MENTAHKFRASNVVTPCFHDIDLENLISFVPLYPMRKERSGFVTFSEQASTPLRYKLSIHWG